MKSVDIAAWDRKEIYDLFSACDHPFYSVSFELDVTNLYAHTHESGLSFYYSLCYLMTRAMEEVEAFRMRIRDGRIDIVDELIPSCTDLVPGSDAFVIVTLPHGGDMVEFCRQAKEKAAGQMYLFDREMEKLDTLVYFSCYNSSIGKTRIKMQTFRIIAKNPSHENAASKLVLAAVRFFILAVLIRFKQHSAPPYETTFLPFFSLPLSARRCAMI